MNKMHYQKLKEGMTNEIYHEKIKKSEALQTNEANDLNLL